MSRERNRTHKRNRKKKEMQFFNSKATFVAGVTVVLMSINDIISLFTKIPSWVSWFEIVIASLLYVLALCTKKMDKRLNTKGAENFGAYLTVISIVAFILGRVLNILADGKEFAWRLSNEVMQSVIVLLPFTAVAVGGAIFLLVCKYPEEK